MPSTTTTTIILSLYHRSIHFNSTPIPSLIQMGDKRGYSWPSLPVRIICSNTESKISVGNQAMLQVFTEEDINHIRHYKKINTSLFIISGGGQERAPRVHRKRADIEERALENRPFKVDWIEPLGYCGEWRLWCFMNLFSARLTRVLEP